MSKVCVTEDYLQDIADAIREKGVEGTFTPAQMGDAVRQISGGGGGFDISKIKVLNAYKTNTIPSNDSDCMLTKFYIESISSTDYKMSLFTYTATNDCKVIFSSWSQARTNTGSNEGYISVEVNGVQKFKKYLTTDTQMAVNFPASFNLEANDVLTLNVGFDNAHTNCRWYIQTYPVVVEDVSGGVYHLDNKKIAQADPAEYITTPLDIDMVAGKWYQVNIRDVSESESETHVIEWNESETFDWGTGKQLLITSTTAGLSYYSGYWRDIYCDIIAIGEVYPNE